MERLSQLVRWAAPAERADVLRKGIVDAAAVVFQAARCRSCWRTRSATGSRSSPVAGSLATERNRVRDDDAAQGRRGRVGALLRARGACSASPMSSADPRFAGRARRERIRGRPSPSCRSSASASRSASLCLTEVADEQGFSREEANVLRLLGMQVSEFLAADPEVGAHPRGARTPSTPRASAAARSRSQGRAADPDAELARAVCEAVAAEVEPARVLAHGALERVAGARRGAGVALSLDPGRRGRCGLEREAGIDGSASGDREQPAREPGAHGDGLPDRAARSRPGTPPRTRASTRRSTRRRTA